ncbi:MAG: O-antigen ligase domain-containing protein [Planctomycetota bacterium]
MTALVPLALFGWIPVVLTLYSLLPARLATGIAFAAGWCFLPMASYPLPGLPDYSKMFATAIGSLVGLAIYHPGMLTSLRPRAFDLAALTWCLCPLGSSLSNGLGVYDGVSAVVHQTITWGLPYLIGRAVYRKTEDLVPLATSILICGVLYVPLCLWEIRMSPQLHAKLYGYHQHSFAQTVRFGGYRPTVFMQHGLQVSLWMASCFIIAFSAWWVGSMKRLRSVPMLPVVLSLGTTLILCKSLGAWFLAMLAVAALMCLRQFRIALPVTILAFIVPLYASTRIAGVVSGESIVHVVETLVNQDKAESLQFRLVNENMLIGKAMERPIFGWGGWGRNRVRDEAGHDMTVTDGLWIITLGINGLVGLISMYAMLLWGPVRILSKMKRREMTKQPTIAVAIGLSAVCILHAVDSLPNAMVIPVFAVASGALSSAAARKRLLPERPQPARPSRTVRRSQPMVIYS